MKTIPVRKVKQGEQFAVSGHKYIALDQVGEGVLSVEAMSFDDVEFGRTNDWHGSSIREYLNGDYMGELEDNGLDLNAELLPLTIDLKQTNGGREYGHDTCKVGLLTLEQYIKYAEYIPLDPDNGWWLATPWGTPNGRSPSTYTATYAWFVSTNGYVGGRYTSSSYGVRPALVFSSDLLVSVNGENEAVGVGMFTSKELADELARRLAKEERVGPCVYFKNLDECYCNNEQDDPGECIYEGGIEPPNSQMKCKHFKTAGERSGEK